MKGPGLSESRSALGALGFFFSGIILLGMFWFVPLTEVWRSMSQIDPTFMIVAMVIASINVLLRGGRWALLFGAHHPIDGRSASRLVAIGLA